MNKQPFWQFLPYINNRTAWKPISFPAILTIPFGYAVDGSPIPQSVPKDVVISILDTVRRNKVSGHQYKNVFFPDAELYTLTINDLELNNRIIDIHDFQNDGVNVTIINRKGVSGSILYIEDALYYDFSDVELSVDNLSIGRYTLSYKARLQKRVYDSLNNLVCINDDQEDVIITNLEINHPGEILNETVKTSPSIWFSNNGLDKEPLITLYKPLTDCLQNVFDEQILLSRINFISKAYPETIQLLGQTIGWEIPYFPESLDPLRKAVLRTSTYFQKNRSSFTSIHKLFDLFGYDILIRNLWYKPDNSQLIEPSYSYAPVQHVDQYVLDVAISNLIAPGFYSTEVPLINRPSIKTIYDNFIEIGSDVHIDAYAVQLNSPADIAIKEFIQNGNYDDISLTINGLVNNDLNSRLTNKSLISNHKLKIDVNNKVVDTYKTGNIILGSQVSIDKYKPNVKISLDGHWNDDNVVIHIFVMYKTQKVVINDSNYDEKRSNFFDIRVNNRDDTLSPTSLVLEYALEFLYRIKALHSLLRHIYLESSNEEVYLVTDYCYGSGLSISSDSDAGKQQVPPAIIPEESLDQCSKQDARLLGYKESDIKYRNRIISKLIEEWEAYLSFDDRSSSGGILGMLPQIPDTLRTNAYYNSYGQDAFIGDYEQITIFGVVQPFHLSNQLIYTRSTNIYNYNDNLININNRCTDFKITSTSLSDSDYTAVSSLNQREPICFKGRVSNDLLMNQSTNPEEQVLLSGCVNHMGNGALFVTPRKSVIVRNGAKNRAIGSNSFKPLISSNQPVSGIDFDDYYNIDFDLVGYDPIRLTGETDNILHYWDRPSTIDITWNSATNSIPNFGIEKTNMHFPGTRFISMAKYDGTFTSSDYQHRPWDFDICDDPLNAKLITGIDKNEYLVFDSVSYSFTNNTGTPDIPLMGQPTVSDIPPDQVVHAIYSRFADGLDFGLCPFDTSVDQSDTINVNAKLFRSAIQCGTGDLRDYADGYPCVTGLLDLTIDFDSDFDIYTVSTGAVSGQFLFLLMSGIIDGSVGIRLDCNCNIVPCDITSLDNTCDVKEIDDVEIDSYLNLYEARNLCSIALNGEIPSMFELNN